MNKKMSQLSKSLIAVLLGFIAGAILILAIGENPLKGYLYLLLGGIKSIERIGNTIAIATTLMLTGLSVAFAFKTGLFNIGAAGQMLIGGLVATAIGLTFEGMPRIILIPFMLIGALIGGGLWGAIPGVLKAKFNVNEVVATIMTNWIAYWVIYYTVPAFFKGEFLETESRMLPLTSSLRIGWLTSITGGSYLNMGLFLAVIVVFFIRFILDRTTLGYELKAVGHNRDAAQYAGINVNRDIILSMVIAGALAGLAGATYYTGYGSNIQIGKLPTQGFDGIAVALLGASNPIGVMIAALFFGMLQAGKGFMNAMTDIPPDLSDAIIAIIIYFTAISLIIEKFYNKWFVNRKAKKAKGGDQS